VVAVEVVVEHLAQLGRALLGRGRPRGRRGAACRRRFRGRASFACATV
jgi:hypothetical protein